jgi:hypothetical protein
VQDLLKAKINLFFTFKKMRGIIDLTVPITGSVSPSGYLVGKTSLITHDFCHFYKKVLKL